MQLIFELKITIFSVTLKFNTAHMSTKENKG